MKKIIPLAITIFLAIFIFGCANDEYSIEQKYWYAQKQAGNIFSNPDASPTNQLDRIVKVFEDFSGKYPKSNLSIDAQFTIARLYIVKKEYEKGRGQLKKIIKNYPKTPSICAEALFLTGNSYEIEEKWGLALEQYKKIIQDYPITTRGMDVPVYIAIYYKGKYQPDKMLEAYQEAIAHYKALAQKYPGSPLALTTYTLIANCYAAIKDWQNTIATFDFMIKNYKDKVNLDQIFINMAVIYKNELKDEGRAKEALEQLIKDYPKSRLVKMARNLLKELEKK